MSSYYQSHKHQANSKIQARLQEAEMHRLAKQGAPRRESFISAIKNLFSRRPSGESAGQKGNILSSPSRERYAD